MISSDDERPLCGGTRDSFKGTSEEFSAVLLGFASEHGPNFVTYGCEAETCKHARLIVQGRDGVAGHHKLLAKLHNVQPNLSFPKRRVLSALDLVYREHRKREGWAMSKSEAEDWRVTICRRIRCLCRVVAQGQLKSSRSGWVAALPWRASETKSAEEGSTHAWKTAVPAPSKKATQKHTPSHAQQTAKRTRINEKSHGDTYEYGFDTETQLPWRLGSDGAREPALPLPKVGEYEEEELVAEWPDGHKARLPGVTGKTIAEKPVRRTACEDLATMTHCKTHHKVYLRQRVDHNLIVVAFDQRKHLACIKMNLWGKIADERAPVDPSHPACQGCVKFMTKLIKKYCDDEVSKEGINKLKNEMLVKEFGSVRGVPMRMMKRPAAADKSDADASVEKEGSAKLPAKPKKVMQARAGNAVEAIIHKDHRHAAGSDGQATPPPNDWLMPAPPAPFDECLF